MAVGKTRAMPGSPKDATTHTTSANAARELGFDPADFDRASRGPGRAASDRGDRRAVRAGVGLQPLRVHRAGLRQSRRRSTRACGGRRSSTTSTACSRSTTGCGRPAGYDISNITFIAGDDRVDRDRPADGRGDRAGVSRAGQRAPRRAAGHRRDLHALARRPLRRRARRDHARPTSMPGVAG